MYDLVVIGGGPGGYVAAIRAAQLGRRVALVEGRAVGGTCLNVGCIPSKTLIQAAEVYRTVQEAAQFGVRSGPATLDFGAMMERQAQVVARLADGVRTLLKGNRVELLQGWGRLAGPGAVRVTRDSGEVAADLRAERILIATGSRPALPPVPGLDLPGVVTSDSFWSVRALPARTVVVGGGMIGIEMAHMLAALGSQVAVVELLPQILAQADREMVRYLTRYLSRSGLQIMTGAALTAVDPGPGQGLAVGMRGPQGPVTLPADLVVVATGRLPNVEQLDLGRAGVACGRTGIQVTDRFETTAPGIYAIGDVIGGGLAHVASAQAQACVGSMFGAPAPFDPTAVPSVLYTRPELAWVGMTEEQARTTDPGCTVSRFPLSALGRAHTLGETGGLVKVIAGAGGSRLLGIHWLSPHAGEQAGEGVLAMSAGLSPRQLAETIHPHPTLSEALAEAAHGLFEGAIHTLRAR